MILKIIGDGKFISTSIDESGAVVVRLSDVFISYLDDLERRLQELERIQKK